MGHRDRVLLALAQVRPGTPAIPRSAVPFPLDPSPATTFRLAFSARSMLPAYNHLDETLATKLIQQAGLGDIDAKVRGGERLTLADGVRLYETPHL